MDAERAFRFYSKAAAAGDPTAFSHLGHMYAQGIGVEGDNATALEYFRKGAAKAHPPSQNGLGYMYMHGYAVAQSHKKALEYFKAAAEKGDATAWKTPPALPRGPRPTRLPGPPEGPGRRCAPRSAARAA